MKNILKYEQENYLPTTIIAGFDEVGRGAIAGPIVVAAVILQPNFHHPIIKDSKKLTFKQRNQAFEIIMANSLAVTVSIQNSKIVDQYNPKQTSILGMIDAFKQLKCIPQICLIDFEKPQFPNFSGQVVSLIKGDEKAINIAAASIIAKVTRDNIMIEFDKMYPQYDFKTHKGYFTKCHQEALKKYGILSEHRISYRPVKEILNK